MSLKLAVTEWIVLLYTGEATYPWTCIGGRALYSFPGNPSTSSTTPQTAGQPAITAPLAGEYNCEIWANPTSSEASRIFLFNGAVQTVSCEGTMLQNLTQPVTAAKGASLNVRYAREMAGPSITFWGLRLWVEAVRVG